MTLILYQKKNNINVHPNLSPTPFPLQASHHSHHVHTPPFHVVLAVSHTDVPFLVLPSHQATLPCSARWSYFAGDPRRLAGQGYPLLQGGLDFAPSGGNGLLLRRSCLKFGQEALRRNATFHLRDVIDVFKIKVELGWMVGFVRWIVPDR